MKKIRIAIIGCGRVAEHYKIILKSGLVENFEIIGVCDKDIDKARNYSKYFKCEFFIDLEKMIKNTKPNLLLVLTPSGEHFNNAKMSLSMNCNTIVEKPITMLSEQAEELNYIAEEKKLMFGVVYQNRFNPSIQYLKKELENNNFGKIITASIRLRWCRRQDYYEDDWHGTWKQDGGVINQQAIHHVDAMQWINGPFDTVSASFSNQINN